MSYGHRKGREKTMQSMITKQPKDTRKQTTVSLSGSVLTDLEMYCRFIDSSRDWVINEALKAVFQKDRAFLEWKAQQTLGADVPVGMEEARIQRKSSAPNRSASDE